MYKFLIIDDHELFSNGLKQIIEKYIPSEIVTIHDPLLSLSVNFNDFDMAFVDMDMPHMKGLELIKTVIDRGEKTRYLIISMHNKPSLIRKAKKLGVLGYMLKDDNVEDIIKATEAVLNDQVYMSPKIDQDNFNTDNSFTPISPREEQVLRYIAMGKTMKEIGDLLNISPDTAITHGKKIKQKLKIDSKAGLIKYAVENLLT
ncbi:response regulator [Flammeovirga aprica]|uniref:Response regulator transcription factor n=1 Tax=Flammeovirga aprica JL-4 TaxID=694437 RepID=A0A7X9X9J7_9BACT|nr:response regulator transcription factor [Flammeovirga aprica]NME68819.1 response regulator transcription factor [Flammeovirga aprica JL-4]